MLKIPSVFFLVFFITIIFTKNAEGSLPANYIYEIKLKKEPVAYIFGSMHQGYSEIPVSMGRCAKSYLTLANEVIIEADELANRIHTAVNLSSPRMSEVIKFLNEDEIKFIEDNSPFFLSDKSKEKIVEIDAVRIYGWLGHLMASKLANFMGISAYSLDAEVFLAARFLEKKISYLESPGEQLSYLRIIPPDAYAEQIKILLKDIQDPKIPAIRARQHKKLIEAVAKGVEEDLILGYKPDSRTFEDQLIVRRNPTQAKKIAQLLDGPAKRPIFIALGALHLPSENGVPALLAKKGYEVRQVCTEQHE